MAIPPSLIEKKFINGRWVLWFNNREAFLAGKYPDPPPDAHGKQRLEIQNLDGAQGDQSRADKADYRPRMQSLSSHTNNFFRFWVIAYFIFSKPEDLNPPDKSNKTQCDPIRPSVTSSGVELWRQRYCPFLLTDETNDHGQPKWDLSRFNQDYFFRMNRMIETALEYGIVVQLTLFDRCGIDFDTTDRCLRWPQSPWRSENNINGLIVTSGKQDPGVNRFYQRDLPGVIRVLKPGHVHPGDDTSIDPDPDNYVERRTTLGALQDAYVHKVVSETMHFPNVVYEIMNEPIHNPSVKEQRAAEAAVRANWANALIPAIYNLTQRQRYIFYNDHSGLDSWTNRGRDIMAWETLKNFGMLDGVIFHGDVKEVNPEKLGWTFRNQLIIQVSSDNHTDETQDYNLKTTNNAFANHMMYQAEALTDEAAQGIGSASPPPTLFNLPDFIGKWWKLTAQSTPNFFPHLVHVVNPDATVVDLNQDTDQFTMQGRIVSIGPGTLTSLNSLSGKMATFDIEFPEPERMRPPVPLSNVTLLQFTRDNIVQVFRKLDERDRLYRFYFKWERVSVVPPDTPIPPFYLFIYPDRLLVTRRVSDFVENNRATITNISTTQIFIHNANNVESVWNYTFANKDPQLTLAKVLLKPDDKPLTQTYRRLL
jgi:hypothetical protein